MSSSASSGGKRKDGDRGNGCQALAVRETGWRNMSVIVMSLSQHVSRCDRASLSVKIRRAPAPHGLFVWSLACPIQF